MSHLSPESVEALGSYVYALIDPRKNQSDPSRVFYVGKGKGQRCFTHADDELKSVAKDEPNPKLQLIREIRVSTGAPPPIEIVAHRLGSEEALRVEAVLIKLLNTDGNLASGKYTANYWQSVEQIEGCYSHPLNEADLGHRVLLVSLNGSAKGDEPLPPFPEIKDGDLPRRVLSYWGVSDANADQVEYIAGVYQQLVRRVFKVHRATDGRAIYQRVDRGPKSNGKPNWKRAFSGNRCFEIEALWSNRRIVNATGEVLSKFPKQTSWRLVGKPSKK
jgi:hypothetical protein